MRALRLAVLGITLFASPLAAQSLPITWEGKPALLIISGRGFGDFMRYPAQFRGQGYHRSLSTIVYRLAAAIFHDSRPCAVQPWNSLGLSGPSSSPQLNIGPDSMHVLSFGHLAPDGSLAWMPGVGLGARIAYLPWTGGNDTVYNAGGYIAALQTANRSACPYAGGVEFMALVLVIEGISW